MPKPSFLIYGPGGHAQVVADLVRLQEGEIVSFFSDGPITVADVLPYDAAAFPEARMIIGIGNNQVREKLADQVAHQFVSLIHPRTSFASSAVCGVGTVILANAVVQAHAVIGKHVVINAGACVDHDAVIEDFVHIAPNACVGGGAVVEKSAVIGPGAFVMRNMRVKAGTEVKALAVVG